MGALFLLNFVLIAIPIGTTLGVLLGIQSQREANGQEPLFKPDRPTRPDGKPIPGDNGIEIEYYCDKTLGISPLSQGDHYTLNPNPWGWDKGDPGSLCMNVTTWNNQTYPKEASAPEWSVTWKYPPGPADAPVHAFPNVKVDSGAFPSAIEDIDKILLDFEWTYAIGNSTAETKTVTAELDKSEVNANVALDMFSDKDKKKAQDSEKAATEVMVWFAAFGPATQPIGLDDGELDTQEIDGTTFSLYSGKNGFGQNVLTWYATKPADKFHGDLRPLVSRLVKMAKTNFPENSDYIGYMSLGTEAYCSDDYVTFHVPELAIDVSTK